MVHAPIMVADTLRREAEKIGAQGVGNWEHLVHQTLHEFAHVVGGEILDIPVTILLETDIPRQRGMSGSSGMIIALLSALLELHGLKRDERFKPERLARIALKVEEQLGVTAGLQDRVLQCYAVDGADAVFMDFSIEAFERWSGEHGDYEPMNVPRVPPMALVLSSKPSHSGAAHQEVRAAIEASDRVIINAMADLADLAMDAKKALQNDDWWSLGEAMQTNAEGRVRIYGEDRLGQVNIALRGACEAARCPANFTGSGGAMIALLPDGDESYLRLRSELDAIKHIDAFELHRVS
jgi:glucuronokinase